MTDTLFSSKFKRLLDAYEQQQQEQQQQHLIIFEQELQKVLQQLDQQNDTISAQTIEIDTLMTLSQRLNEENEQQLSQLDQQQQTIDNLTTEIENWRSTAAAQRKTINELRDITMEYSQQVEQLSAQNSRLSTQIERLNAQSSEQENNHNRLSGLIARFKTLINT